MNKHNWECISPGDYDTTYRCTKCGIDHTISVDNIASRLPEYGCTTADDYVEEEIAFFKSNYGTQITGSKVFENVTEYVRITEYKNIRMLKLSNQDIVNKMLDNLNNDEQKEMAEHEVKMNIIKDKKAKLLSIGYDGNNSDIDEIPF